MTDRWGNDDVPSHENMVHQVSLLVTENRALKESLALVTADRDALWLNNSDDCTCHDCQCHEPVGRWADPS